MSGLPGRERSSGGPAAAGQAVTLSSKTRSSCASQRAFDAALAKLASKLFRASAWASRAPSRGSAAKASMKFWLM